MNVQFRCLSFDRAHARSLTHLLDFLQTVARAMRRVDLSTRFVVVREHTVELIETAGFFEHDLDADTVLSGLTTTQTAQGRAQAVGLIEIAPESGLTHIFVEADDGSWAWRELTIHADTTILAVQPDRGAAQGDGLPARFGRWWVKGRRRAAQASIGKAQPLIVQ